MHIMGDAMAGLGGRALILSTGLVGGAGLAARRHARALQVNGWTVGIASRSAPRDFEVDFLLGTSPSFRARSAGTRLLNRKLQAEPEHYFLPLSAQVPDLNRLQDFEADAVFVHNWFNLLSPGRLNLLAKLAPRVVFVLHDERLFTGGCHYAFDCIGLLGKCRGCPRASHLGRAVVARTHGSQGQALTQLPKVSIIAPSKWIQMKARESSLLKDFDIRHIANPIDPAVFSHHLRPRAREDLGLMPSDIVIGWQSGKGNDLFRSTLMNLRASLPREVQAQVVLNVLGDSDIDTLGFRLIETRPVQNENRIAQYWAACDLAVTTTPIDNFPNVVLESLSSQVPIVVPDVGGAAEAVKATHGGLVVEERSASNLSEAVRSLVLSQRTRETLGACGRRGIQEKYSLQVIGREITSFVGA